MYQILSFYLFVINVVVEEHRVLIEFEVIREEEFKEALEKKRTI